VFDRILVATDGSEHSEGAAKFAVDLARLPTGKVTALYVADTAKYFTSAGEVTFNIADEIIGSVRSATLEEGDKATRRVEEIGKAAGVEVERKVVEGNPAKEILKAAEDMHAEVIAIGSIGRTGIEEFLLGSVAEKVVRNSKVPVLVVRKDGSQGS
jgi:nucleotide-binding universal stress UspA family protein